jgi:hypothetical protein
MQLHEFRPGDRVRTLPNTPHHAFGLRSGRVVSAHEIRRDFHRRRAPALGVSPEELTAIFRAQCLSMYGEELSDDFEDQRVLVVELDPCATIPMPGFEAALDPDQLVIVPADDPAHTHSLN